MDAEENNLPPDRRAAVVEPFFTEEAEEEARPVVPLGQMVDAGRSSKRARGRLQRSFILVLVVIAAGSAGAVAGYLAHMGRAPQPAAEETAGVTPEPDAPRASVSNSTDTSTVEKSETRVQPELPARVELERPKSDKVDVRGREGEERAERVREAEQPRREDDGGRVERRRGVDEKRAGRHADERRVVRRDEGQDGKPKARLVGTITGRPRPY